jgi:hypothetical protein
MDDHHFSYITKLEKNLGVQGLLGVMLSFASL